MTMRKVTNPTCHVCKQPAPHALRGKPTCATHYINAFVADLARHVKRCEDCSGATSPQEMCPTGFYMHVKTLCTERQCLSCSKPFISEGSWNRICNDCNNLHAGRGQNPTRAARLNGRAIAPNPLQNQCVADMWLTQDTEQE